MRVLIFYIVHNSGHHVAARNLEVALRRQVPGVETLCVDLLKHTHPRWEKVIRRMYMLTVRRTPELWDALYDNFWVEHLSRRLRGMIQKGKSESLQKLIAGFSPRAILCTQAYPFAVVASFMARYDPDLPLFAVTTDFVPHRFWVISNACNARFVVTTDSGAARLMWLGVDRERIHVLGIPVLTGQAASIDCARPAMRSRERRILLMGGSRGMGVRYETARKLDRCPDEFTMDVVCGTNRRLRRRLLRNRRKFRHPIRVRGYVSNAVALMSRADLMITKAGGMTLAEATSFGTPLLLVRPLPGQEIRNTEVMVHHGAALHVSNEYDIPRGVSMLLNNPALLGMMREKALAIARPDAAERIVRLVLESVSRGDEAS